MSDWLVLIIALTPAALFWLFIFIGQEYGRQIKDAAIKAIKKREERNE